MGNPIIDISNSIAQKKVGENRELIPGKVAYRYDDNYYNIDADKSDQNGNNVPLVRIQPIPSLASTEFPVGSAVTVLRYNGKDCQTEIIGSSNVTYPEETICNFSTVEEVTESNIYLCVPDTPEIQVYSLTGTAGTALTGTGNELYYCCTDGTYIYFSFYLGYVMGKIKADGTDYSSICNSTYYSSIYGLAVKGEYLYTADESSGYITRITIADGTINSTWKELSDITFSTIKDLRGDSNYLYILYNDFSSQYIAKYDYSGNYQGSVNL